MSKKTNEGYELLSGTKVQCFRDYHKAEEVAQKLGLKESEYGDAYGISYCYWNETGDRYEDEEVVAWYRFDENGKPTPLTDYEAKIYEDKLEIKFDDLEESLKETISDKDTVKDAFGKTDKEAKDYLKKADKNTVKELRKGFEQNAKKSFLTDSVEEKKTAKIVSKRPITEGAEGHKIPGREFVIYEENAPHKIVAIRSTMIEASYFTNKYNMTHKENSVTYEEAPKGRFHKGENYPELYQIDEKCAEKHCKKSLKEDSRDDEIIDRLNYLVNAGVISREEASAKIQLIKDRIAAQSKSKQEKISQVLDKINNAKGKDFIEKAMSALVPPSGSADTLAGELIRAISRLMYRYYNDGDLFYEGDGVESCGAPAHFIYVKVDDAYDKLVETAEDGLTGEKYENALNELAKIIEKYITEENPESLIEPNQEDMWSYDSKYFVDLAPRVDLYINVPEELVAHLEKGNIDEDDLSEIKYWDGFSGDEEITYDAGYQQLLISEVRRPDYDYLEQHCYDWLLQWAEDLTNEYGDPLEESCKTKKCKKSHIKIIEESVKSDDIIDDLVDRTVLIVKDQMRDGRKPDIKKAIPKAIDDGLIHYDDRIELGMEYNVIDDRAVLDDIYDRLFWTIYDIAYIRLEDEDIKLDESCKKRTSKKLTEGASNFWSMKDLPLLIFGDYIYAYDYIYDMTKEQLGDDYEGEIEDSEEFEKNFEEYFDYCLLDEEEQKSLQQDIDEFNEKVKNDAYEDEEDLYNNDYAKVEIKPGYYGAAQLWCDTKDISEKAVEKVAKFFDEMKKKYGLTQLGVSWRASNGETGYHKIEEALPDFDEDILNKTIKVYDLNGWLKEETKDDEKHYKTFHYDDGAAIIITENGTGCIVDSEAIGKSFQNTSEEVRIEVVEEDKVSDDGKTISFKIMPDGYLPISIDEIKKQVTAKEMKVKDFFKRRNYNDRLWHNFRNIIPYLDTAKNESLADDKDWNRFVKRNGDKRNTSFDRAKYGKYFDKEGRLIPEKRKEFFAAHGNIDEALDEKTVIYKVMGEYHTTPESNYGGRMQNSRKVQNWKDFNSAKEIIDYCIKYGWAKDASEFIIKDE